MTPSCFCSFCRAKRPGTGFPVVPPVPLLLAQQCELRFTEAFVSIALVRFPQPPMLHGRSGDWLDRHDPPARCTTVTLCSRGILRHGKRGRVLVCMCVLVPGKVDVGIFVVQILDSGTALVGFLALAFRTGRCGFNRAHNCLRGVRFAIHVGPHNAIDRSTFSKVCARCSTSCKAKQVVRCTLETNKVIRLGHSAKCVVRCVLQSKASCTHHT